MTTANSGRWACTVCSFAYDPRNGDPDRGIAPGTAFEALADDWKCPWCGAAKSKFKPEADWEPISPDECEDK